MPQNNYDANFTEKLMRVAMPAFESKRVLSKNVNTDYCEGQFNKESGESVSVTRNVDHVAVETPDGDLTSENPSPILTGKAQATVQPYITVYVDFKEADQAIKMAEQDKLVDLPAMNRLVTKFETNFAKFAVKNTSMLSGTPGVGVDKWEHVARAGAMATSLGIPQDGGLRYFMNPFSEVKLAGEQRSLGVNPQAGSANEQATIKEDFAGVKVMRATTLASLQTHSGADRAGTLAVTPTSTYESVANTFTQTLSVTGFQPNLEIRAGEQVTVSGRHRLNLSTRELVIDESGNPITFSGTVVTPVTLDGSGAGQIVVTAPAIYEANGAYNTVVSQLASGDVVTLGGAASSIIQPNLFWHKNAFTIASVPMEKLYSTDTIAKTADGLEVRCSRGGDIITNKQIIRFDIRPAFGAMNQYLAGQSFGW